MPCRNELFKIERRGPNNFRWRGGVYEVDGRVFVKADGHPYANKYGYVLRARLVVEQTIGRYLLPSEHVHHVNEIKNDDRPENLQYLSNSQHTSLHMKKRWTPENRKKLSELMTGRTLPAAWVENIKNALTGKPKSQLHRQHLKDAWIVRRANGGV